MSVTRVPAGIAVTEDDWASWALLCYTFRHQGFELSGMYDGASSSEFRIRQQSKATVLNGMLTQSDGSSSCEVPIEDSSPCGPRVLFPTGRSEKADRLRRPENAAKCAETEFLLLQRMTRRPRQVLSRATLPDPAWCVTSNVSDCTEDLDVPHLHRKLERPSKTQYGQIHSRFGTTVKGSNVTSPYPHESPSEA